MPMEIMLTSRWVSSSHWGPYSTMPSLYFEYSGLSFSAKRSLCKSSTLMRCTLPSGSWLGGRKHAALSEAEESASSKPRHLGKQAPGHLHELFACDGSAGIVCWFVSLIQVIGCIRSHAISGELCIIVTT